MNRIVLLCSLLLLASCGDADGPASSASPDVTPGEPPAAQAQEPGRRMTLEEIKADLNMPVLSQPWTGDFDGMVERRVVRVLTVYGVGRYYLDGVNENGFVYEQFRLFEKAINKRQKRNRIRLHVVFIPVARDELIPALLEGRGDVIAAGMTVTPERQEKVDFTSPMVSNINEILVTGPTAPPIESIEDLSGQVVSVRRSSSYFYSLQELNRRFESEGRPPVKIDEVSPFLEDEDLMEMVSRGLLDWALVDDYKTGAWAQVFDNLVPREDIVFRPGGDIAWAIRKDSPKFMAELNTFLKTHRQGTLTGNVLINRHLRDYDWAGSAMADNDFQRFRDVMDIFRKYGDQYGFDFLFVAAQGYQESRLDQSARSAAGAIGIMQVLPSTAADPNVGIPDISKKDPNIHAGVKYMDFIRMRYFNDPKITLWNQTMFSLAAYNAGPARIARLRTLAAEQGYDPNQWFDNVEVVAAREIGSEPVKYVANILKYYVAYRLSMIRELQRADERERAGIG